MRWIEIINESTDQILDSIARDVETAWPGDDKRFRLTKALGTRELNWAREHLKKSDRIDWFMDRFKNFVLKLADPEDISLIYEYIENTVKNQLINFLSMPIPAIHNATWKPGEDIISRFEKYEREYHSEKRGDLRHMWSDKPDSITVGHWPVTGQELRQLELRIFQNPSWIAYWERFGWTSWQWLTCRYWYDKHKQEVSFYDVPCIRYNQDSTITPDRTILKFDLKTQEWDQVHGLVHRYQGQITLITLPTAIQLIRNWIKTNLSGQNLEYLNGTYYVRFGRWRDDERSKNWLASRREGHDVWELGVSAYHADWDIDEQRWNIADGIDYDTINGTLSSLITNANKQIYLVQGRELDTDGEDGEPLLKDVKLIKVLNIKDICFPGVFDPREDELRESINEDHQTTLNQTGYWGSQGAGAIILARDTGRILLCHRSKYIKEPNTWGNWGGALDQGENPEQATRREIAEECGYQGPLQLIPLMIAKKYNQYHEQVFEYFNYLGIVDQEFDPKLDTFEAQGSRWCHWGNWPEPLHPGLVALFNDSTSVAIIQSKIRK